MSPRRPSPYRLALRASATALAAMAAAGTPPANATHDTTPPPVKPVTKNNLCTAAPQENETVATRGGEVYVRLIRPTGPNCPASVPVILTYTPYALLTETVDTVWVRRGYARAIADVVGTGRSGGCWDYGGDRESDSAFDLVEWLGTRGWSNGKVAMMGASYDGTTANMAAVANPPHLATIVPEVAISDWYGYAFGDGVRYFLMDPAQRQGLVIDEQGFDTPAGFDFAWGVVEPRSRTNPGTDLREAEHICPGTTDKLDHTVRGYDTDPVYDAFWRARGYIHDAAKLAEPDGLEIPVLVAGGWRDYNVKHSESTRWFEAIPVDDPHTAADEGVPFKMLLMDNISHGLPGTGFNFDTILHAWFDHFLYSFETNIELQRQAVSKGNDGVIRTDASWPPPGTARVPLYLRRSQDGAARGLLSTTTPGAEEGASGYLDTGRLTEGDALAALDGDGSEVRWWVSAPLTQDLRIAGMAALDLFATTHGATSTQYTPVLFDLGPPVDASNAQCTFVTDGQACTIARGFLNARNRNGLSVSEDLAPGVQYRATVRFIDNDWNVPAGHRIGVAVMSSNLWWALPDQQRARNDIHHDASRPSSLVLPIVGGAGAASAAGL